MAEDKKQGKKLSLQSGGRLGDRIDDQWSTQTQWAKLSTWKIEDTLGGWETVGNFYFADNEKQWRLNAQVWTGAMAGLPIKEEPNEEQTKGKRMDTSRNVRQLPEKTTTPVDTDSQKDVVVQKRVNVNKIEEPAPEEDLQANATPSEFGWLTDKFKDEEITKEEVVDTQKEEPKGQNVNVNTFLQGSTTELFGKMITWADTAPYDHNSTEWLQAEARLKQYERINALTVDQLASNIKSWSILAGWQAMRDLQTYNPEKYQMLQEYQKKQEALDQINMIASGNFTDGNTNLQDQTGNSIHNYLNETVANAGLDANARMDLDTALAQNQWIINYAERMSYYAQQINQIDQTIGNLAEDARRVLEKATWWNVLDFQVQNYINNRSKKLYKQRDNFMNQYNYYKEVYEAQVEQEATAWERDYKERQLKLQESKALWDQKMDEANLSYKNDQLNYDYYKLNAQNPISESSMQWWMTSYIDSIQDKIANHAKIRSWWCGTVVNDYLSSLGIKFQYDNDKATKLNSITPWAWPKVWSIAVWNSTWTPAWDKYWHVAIVTDINNKNGTITVLESNEDTWLRYHTYKQSNVTGYYDPSAWSKSSTTTKSTSNKDEKTYTNDELFTQLRGGKIDYKNFLKNWNGEEPQSEIDDWIWKTYFEKNPMMTLSDMWDSVKELWKMLWDDVVAEHYTLDHLNQNKNISNDKVVKIVSEYVTDTNKWLKEADKISISEYLAEALAWRYGTYDEVKKALDNSKIDYKELTGKKSKQIAKEIIAEWGIED